MPTQPHTEQSPQSSTENKERNDALNCNIKTERALRDLDGFLIAALYIIRMEDQYGDTSEENKKEALETLMEHARGALSDADEGHEGVWRITAGYLYGQQRDAPHTVAETEQREED